MTPLYSILSIGTNDMDVIAAGGKDAKGNLGTLYRYSGSGTSWSQLSSDTAVQYNATWGSGLDTMWVVGDGGSIWHWKDGALVKNSQIPMVTTKNLRSIWGSSQTDIWAVGDAGAVIHYDGITWSGVDLSTIAPLDGIQLNSVWGSSATDLWIAGNGGTILHYKDQVWTTSTRVTTHNLYGVWGSSASNVLFVGEGGAILSYSPPS